MADPRLDPGGQRGELLGALTVETGPSETVRPVELKLAVDLAAQAGHVLGNVRLNEERRRLERNLHDGAQQHLVALRVHLGLAEAAIDEGPDQMRVLPTGNGDSRLLLLPRDRLVCGHGHPAGR